MPTPCPYEVLSNRPPLGWRCLEQLHGPPPCTRIRNGQHRTAIGHFSAHRSAPAPTTEPLLSPAAYEQEPPSVLAWGRSAALWMSLRMCSAQQQPPRQGLVARTAFMYSSVPPPRHQAVGGATDLSAPAGTDLLPGLDSESGKVRQVSPAGHCS
jgi:hypothetical protein